MDFVLGLLGGMLAWAIAETILRPLRRFLALRMEAATALEVYERWTPWADRGAPAADWQAERSLAYRRCAADLLTFAASGWGLPTLLSRLKVDMPDAGFALLELSYLGHDSPERRRAREDVLRGLRLRDIELHS
jgi:hypothetical protein